MKQKSCSFSYALYATETAGHMEETTKHFVPLLLSGPHNPLYHILFSNWIQWSFAIINRKAFDTVGGFDRVVAASSVGTYDPNRLMAFDSTLGLVCALLERRLAALNDSVCESCMTTVLVEQTNTVIWKSWLGS